MQQDYLEVKVNRKAEVEAKVKVEADGMQNADCGMRNIKSQYIE